MPSKRICANDRHPIAIGQKTYDLVLKYDLQSGEIETDGYMYCTPGCVLTRLHLIRKLYEFDLSSLNVFILSRFHGVQLPIIPALHPHNILKGRMTIEEYRNSNVRSKLKGNGTPLSICANDWHPISEGAPTYKLVIEFDPKTKKMKTDGLIYCCPSCVVTKIHTFREYNEVDLLSRNSVYYASEYGIKDPIVPNPDPDVLLDDSIEHSLTFSSIEHYRRRGSMERIHTTIHKAPFLHPYDTTIISTPIPDPQTLFENESSSVRKFPTSYKLSSTIPSDEFCLDSIEIGTQMKKENTIIIGHPPVDAGLPEVLREMERLRQKDHFPSNSNMIQPPRLEFMNNTSST